MNFSLSIPRQLGAAQQIELATGSSVIFVGANGGGKTRLAVHLEESQGISAHRISAHRSLILQPTVAKVTEAEALQQLRFGVAYSEAGVGHRLGSRWQGKQAVHLLSDFDAVIQGLFAEQTNRAQKTHRNVRAGNYGPAEPTKLEVLSDIWGRLLPHRQLHITGDDIQVSITGSSATYSASQMSDGERAIFYMIGQTLLAKENSLLIIDEPELHVHRSIMSKLWDELEAARIDCAFAFITHDLEFAASRVAQKFVIMDYNPVPAWTIISVPDDTGFSEELTTLILGSRRPILFVEGDGSSLDIAIYRSCFPEWTVLARGSCENVIHAVVTLRRNADLTRVSCSGIVDADDYDAADRAYLAELGISTLPVSEIENVLLLPAVASEICAADGHLPAETAKVVGKLHEEVFALLTPAEIETVITRYCRRRIDRALKKIDLSDSATPQDLAKDLANQAANLDVLAIAKNARRRLEKAVADRDINELLALYDNKQMLVPASKYLKQTTKAKFEAWIVRILRSNLSPKIVTAIKSVLPAISAAR
ncbi:AAA family ATPase [Tardiphaga sp. 768_D3_N2_1]|uniref:AAA family ATPase n=1 Tax=Tardiphaga sp. 768_D3_N2_1 TaxID=3240783 RepID=UPI003F89E9A0